MKQLARCLFFTITLALSPSTQAGLLSLSKSPLFLTIPAYANVLIDMSVETPMGGAAYADQPGNPPGCSGRIYKGGGEVGACYFPDQTYLGIFDPEKCYIYDGNIFNPDGPATNHICSGGSQWSGNFLNWATMTAIDMFIITMTGGNRIVDTETDTVLERARAHTNISWYPIKYLPNASGSAPFTGEIYITNHNMGGYRFKVGTTRGGDQYGKYNIKVRVCDPIKGLENNCSKYTDPTTGKYIYKPEGLIQRYADSMRFGVFAYTNDNSQGRDGGVLRAPMHYVGKNKVDDSGLIDANPEKEINPATGQIYKNPMSAAGGLSGVINYINRFHYDGYKSYDPIGEMFYEAVRYLKNLPPTPEYASGAPGGSFPIYTSWNDPIQFSCQKNFIVAINDANPWLDKKLPGTFFTCDKAGDAGMPSSFKASDCGEPSNPDPDINVTALTNQVGVMEGLHTTWTQNPSTGEDTVGYVYGVATGKGKCTNWKSVTVNKLGEVMGTCPYAPKENSYYIAGLAYYANVTDLRPDLEGFQNASSFFIDTQEYNSLPLSGNHNMLYLAGKYGGFTDKNGNKQPDLPDEWDSDSDGIPDNYVMATSPDKLVNGLTKAFNEIIAKTGSAASAATNSTSLVSGSVVYQARFNSGDWSGQLLSRNISLTGILSSTPNWDAGEVIKTQDPDSRTILTFSRDSQDGIPFRWATISSLSDTTQRDLLNQDANGTADGQGNDRVNFLRGSSISGFRSRSTPLGDIVHSTPFYVGAPKAGYLDSSYASFTLANASRTPIIYVGANDGMLHGFDAATGEEKIAYVPGAVYDHLSDLTDPNYGNDSGSSAVPHRYYVDGSPMVADARIGSDWKTVLAGGLNGGGQGYYALDITDPGNFMESKAADIVLWEFTDENDPDLGYTYNQPTINFLTHQSAQIAKMNNGKWALIVGNGYNNTEADGHASSTGHAVLFILFLEGGADGDWTDSGDYIKIDTGAGSVATPNGLATPTPVDIDGDGDVDIAYAGDLEGNLWKFDLTDSDPSNWKVGKLFAAQDAGGTPQPITTAPMVVPHPNGGFVIGFGTGKYLEHADLTTTTTQTLYGIWDDKEDGSVSTVTGGRAKLVEQTILGEVTVSGDSYRVTSNATVDYSSKRGWYMDLPAGERVAYNPIPRDGRFVFVTLIPDSSDPCAAGGGGWIMELDYLDGSRLPFPPFDLTGDHKINDEDKVDYDIDGDGTDERVPPSGKKPDIGIPTTPTVMDRDESSEMKIIQGSTGATESLLEGKSVKTGRLSWREIIEE